MEEYSNLVMCCRCLEFKSPADFKRRYTSKRGYSLLCLSCQKRSDPVNWTIKTHAKNVLAHISYAKRNGFPSAWSIEEWFIGLNYWKQGCAICGSPNNWPYAVHIDHWIAINNEDCPGTVATNMLPLCRHCNSNKYAKNPEQWLVERFGQDEGKRKLIEINQYFDWIACQGDRLKTNLCVVKQTFDSARKE